METNLVKMEVEVAALVDTKPVDAGDLQVVRELSALELSLVGGGQGSVSFM